MPDSPSSTSPTNQHYVVLGGGIAGLTAARELLRRGCRVTLLEAGAEVGGLARTIEREGFRFDLGGHRFHSNNPSVVEWLLTLLGEDLLVVPRFSRIHLQGNFVDYPIRFPGALSIFPPFRAARMLFSFLAAKVTQRNRADVSFEDWVVKRYGQALYDVFFKPYTEKVWGIPCEELSAEWASQRIGLPSMWRAIHHALFPPKEMIRTAVTQFYYPREGFGMISNALERDIQLLGGTIHRSTTLQSLVPRASGASIVARHQDGSTTSLEADQVVSTIPLNFLLSAIPSELGSAEVLKKYDLDYRDIICLMLALKRDRVSGDSWTYFPEKELIFGRTHEPKNFSPEMVPGPGYSSLVVEIFSTKGEPVWQLSDDALVDRVVGQMSEIGWIGREDLLKGWVVRIPFAYPVYRVGYEAKLNAVREYLGQWPALHLVGRTGSFRYMNSDGVVEDVFRFMAEQFPEAAPQVAGLLAEEGRWV